MVALVILFGLVRPALKVALADAPRSAPLHVVADESAGQSAPQRAPMALPAPRSTDRLDTARAVAKQNPAAVANIVREWVKGDA